MADPPGNHPLVALLAGRIASRQLAERHADFATRLAIEGLADGLICLGGSALLTAEGCRALENPWLGRRGLRHLAARQLAADVSVDRPILIHSLEVQAWEAACALAQAWNIGFVQEIDDFDVWPQGIGPSLHPRCRALIAVSEALVDHIVETHGIDRSQILLRVDGIEAPDRAIDPRNIERSNVRVVGVAGPWTPSSGLECFLSAAHQILTREYDVEFVIAGDGPLGEELRHRANKLGISDRVTFAEPPTLDDAFWRVLDVYCQPAVAPTLGRLAATAMAGGVPVVLSNIAGLNRLIQDGKTSRPVPPAQAADLASAIIDLLDRPLEARALGERGRCFVDDVLDPDRAVESLRAIYKRFT
jgi:glycosyltransferase involved in cell wall biosynthesis